MNNHSALNANMSNCILVVIVNSTHRHAVSRCRCTGASFTPLEMLMILSAMNSGQRNPGDSGCGGSSNKSTITATDLGFTPHIAAPVQSSVTRALNQSKFRGQDRRYVFVYIHLEIWQMENFPPRFYGEKCLRNNTHK
jgi:hypothetical protein